MSLDEQMQKMKEYSDAIRREGKRTTYEVAEIFLGYLARRPDGELWVNLPVEMGLGLGDIDWMVTMFIAPSDYGIKTPQDLPVIETVPDSASYDKHGALFVPTRVRLAEWIRQKEDIPSYIEELLQQNKKALNSWRAVE